MPDTKELDPKVKKALLVGLDHPGMALGEADALLDELEELAKNLDVGVAWKVVVRVREHNPHYLIGSGKAHELMALARELGCDCILFDDALSPAQQRNWEQEGRMAVYDRHEVILDIFAERARSREALLQVQLARAEYDLPRLARAWGHLHRQRGGGAIQRDTGETQLQLDRRMVRERISRLRRELVEVVKQRGVQRKRRERVTLPTAAIVGYTNAGKSTLLNRLTGAGQLAADKLFATLDPATRRHELPSGRVILLTDTVGFIRKLPHRLVEAFKATLEEAMVSDFLIHVVDASSPDWEAHMRTTVGVLSELGASDKTVLRVFNKADRLGDAMDRRELELRNPGAVFVSAATGEGFEQLQERMDDLTSGHAVLRLLVPHNRYDLVHRLHKAGAVVAEEPLDEGVSILARVPPSLREGCQAFVVPEAS